MLIIDVRWNEGSVYSSQFLNNDSSLIDFLGIGKLNEIKTGRMKIWIPENPQLFNIIADGDD